METVTAETTLRQIDVVSEISLSYRPMVKPSQRPKISTSKDAFQIFVSTWDEGKISLVEEFKVLFLNKGNRVIGLLPVSIGAMDSTYADPRIIFSAALKACALQIIVAHNHPSENLTPSASDIALTKQLKDGGKILNIQLLDHIILTGDKYFSFADEGLL